MQLAAHPDDADPRLKDLREALPLYAASLVVTLAGIGAVGVTLTTSGWMPLWALLAVMGHGASLGLRYARVNPETIFYPVMLFGSVVIVQQSLTGLSPGGVVLMPTGESLDMATAAVVGALAVVRTFTLVTNASLLFSPVPAITMLALVGSANLNAEVPVFFGLFLLSSLFIMGYEAHLRRMARSGRASGPLLFHLLIAWVMTLGVAGVAVLFPVLLQPVLGQFSPFNLPGMNRLRQLQNFTQSNSQRASVGAGPIRLSPIPVFDVYTPEAGHLRTAVFTSYNGREWRQDPFEAPSEFPSSEQTTVTPPEGVSSLTYYNHWLFRVTQEEGAPGVAERQVRQVFVTRAPSSQGIPGLGLITQIRYPLSFVFLHLNGTVSGTAHGTSGKTFEVTSVIREPSPDQLRAARRVASDPHAGSETLDLPLTTLRVQELARRITRNADNDFDRVQAILQYIEKNCAYTLEGEVTPAGEDAATHYLFKTRRGACDLASTAATVMCRAVGIPSRVAVGYVMEEPLPQGGGYLVRQEHAHMWTEAYFSGYGWVPFDPAPPIARIRDHPLQVLWYRFSSLISKIGGGGLDALLAVIVVLGTLALLLSWAFARVRAALGRMARARRAAGGSSASAVVFTYHRALAMLDRRGWSRAPSMTAGEFASAMRAEWSTAPEAQDALKRLTALFEQAHYGETGTAEDLLRSQEALRDLERLVPRRPRHGRVRAIRAPAS